MKNFFKIFLFIGLMPFSSVFAGSSLDYSQLQKIAVQNEGRIKPLQTYASESMKILTQRSRFEGKDPIESILNILFTQDWAVHHPLIRIDYRPLLKDAGLNVEQKYYSYSELTSNQSLMRLMEETVRKNQNQKQVSPYDRKVLAVYQQVSFLHSLMSGEVLAIVPNPEDQRGYWTTIYEINADKHHANGAEEIQALIVSVGEAFQKKDGAAFDKATKDLAESLRHIHPDLYPSETMIEREILYNHSKPFEMAWMLYLGAFIVSLFLFGSRFFWLSLLPFIAGFGYHTMGIVLRTLISGRAPVSNMYESMNFMVWGICLLAFIFQIFSKKRIFVTVAGLLGFFIMVLSSIMPIDNGIPQLAPVLRSNYWLTIHVLTIMMSYSAFALSMGIGHFILGVFFIKGEGSDLFVSMSRLLYKILGVGILLLIAGTILGGVWANESWGRFWGWDPKETWALISILGYLIIIHARYAGWIGDFGLVLGSILGFVLILITYYGVNFILAAGLHSYGFSAGGTVYFFAFLIFEMILVLFAALYRKKKLKTA